MLDWSRSELPTVAYYKSLNSPHFDCEVLKPDLITLSIDIGPSLVMLYGTFLKRLWYIKESFFGWDQLYTECLNPTDSALLKSTDPTQNANMVSRPYYDVPTQLALCNLIH